MIPVEAVLLRFPRLVRDLCVKLSKQVELELVGKDTELDRSVVDSLGDPLVHLIRNSLDHGLEGPAEREAAGKPETGKLEIEARHAGGNVIISVKDDGRGIDAERVARKARERGLIGDEPIDLARATELLFHPGFSTSDTTSDISGRGVGMDAVRVAIRELGGEVTLTSEPGQGTCAEIRLPLTLAIMTALIVQADGRPFAIPLDRIERTVRTADHPVRSVAGPPHAGAQRRRAAARRRRRAVRRLARRRRRLRGRRARQRRAAGVRGQRHWTASASSSRARCRPKSPKDLRSRAPPCCPTGRSP